MKKFSVEGNLWVGVSSEIEAENNIEAIQKFAELCNTFSGQVSDCMIEGVNGDVGDSGLEMDTLWINENE